MRRLVSRGPTAVLLRAMVPHWACVPWVDLSSRHGSPRRADTFWVRYVVRFLSFALWVRAFLGDCPETEETQLEGQFTGVSVQRREATANLSTSLLSCF